MGMCINQSGHQKFSLAIDDLYFPQGIRGYGACGNLCNHIVRNDHVAHIGFFIPAIKNLRMGKEGPPYKYNYLDKLKYCSAVFIFLFSLFVW